MQNQVATMKWLLKLMPCDCDKSEEVEHKIIKAKRNKFAQRVMQYVARSGRAFTKVPIRIDNGEDRQCVFSMKERFILPIGAEVHCIVAITRSLDYLSSRAPNLLVILDLDCMAKKYATPSGIVYRHKYNTSAGCVIILLMRRMSKFSGNIDMSILGTDGSNVVKRARIVDGDIDFDNLASVRAYIPKEFTDLPEFKDACAQFDRMMSDE